MRNLTSHAGLEVRAIAGSHVVLLAINASQEVRAGLRGFAISRKTADGDPMWLRGIKFFKDTAPDWKKGDDFSTYDQPIQSFFWSDYAARPGTGYTFKIVAKYGATSHLTDGTAVEISIRTEDEDDGKHGIWFNRGIVASHKFAKTFQNKPLTEKMASEINSAGKFVSEEASWLSRGLAEALLANVNGCKPGEGLRLAVYEFTWSPVLEALKRAKDRGVDVRIVCHATPENQKAIDKAGLTDLVVPRTRPPIPHNKFILKLVGGQPRQVWTGSTNLTDSGLLGQTNVGHLVTDPDLARIYLDYWTALSDNPTVGTMVPKTMGLSPNPPNAIPQKSIAAFYSPRVADNMLDWYAQRITDASSLAMITLPFNVADQILTGLDQATRSLRLAILEMEPDDNVIAAEVRNKGRLAFSNGSILGKDFTHNKAGGAKVAPIVQGELDKWYLTEELARPYNKGHVFFVHSKILLIDPLSDDPLVCTGSANFSSNSLISNDENMVLIRGQTRVADIYLTELDRIFKHFYDRNMINRSAARGDPADHFHLDDTQGWVDKNFRPGSYKFNRLQAFFPPGGLTQSWAEAAAQNPDPFADEDARAAARRKKARERAAAKKADAAATPKKKNAKPTAKKTAKKSVKKAGKTSYANRTTKARKNLRKGPRGPKRQRRKPGEQQSEDYGVK